MKKSSTNKNKSIEKMLKDTESEILEIMKDNSSYTENLIYFKLKRLGQMFGHDYSNKLLLKLELDKKYNIQPDLGAELTDLLDARKIKDKSKEE